jgi:heme-degrading monooxygenase HmoA
MPSREGSATAANADCSLAANTQPLFDMPKDGKMIVVIFESWPKPGRKQSYLDMAAALMPLVEKTDGFISIERFQSVSEESKMVALSFWRDEAAVTAWRNVMEHRRVQDRSRHFVFDNYRMRVAHVIRDYSKGERGEAPDDSVATAG